jgi:putative PIN family toxin of toxin-antitoxin system
VSAIVLDTNIVLDLFVFSDPASHALCAALERGEVWGLATADMHDELVRVLAYPQIVKSLRFHAIAPERVVQRWNACVRRVEPATKAPVTCKDADDQKFIDLAVAHQAPLLSKDQAVLCMARRLQPLGVEVSRCWRESSPAGADRSPGSSDDH